jgi:hypothetical protein
MPTGYSGKPLFEKLGVKPGEPLFLVNAPREYFEFLELPKSKVTLAPRFGAGVKVVHAFAETAVDLRIALEKIAPKLSQGQSLWVSWKKGKVTDVTEDSIRKLALPLGVVDVKVCSVSDVWSGLKLVRRAKKS